MKVLVPLLTGLEAEKQFVDAFTQKVDEVIVLQIVDRGFMSKTSAAIGEVRQFREVMDSLRKTIGAKRKKCIEMTEWGETVNKTVSIALLQKVDKVFLVKQKNQFFNELLKGLKKNKVVVQEVEVKKPKEEGRE